MIDLVLVPYTDCFTNTVLVDVVLKSEQPEWVHAVDLAFGWDPRSLKLVGSSFERSDAAHQVAGIPGLDIPASPWDFYGVNESFADGNAYFMWLGPLTGAANAQYLQDAVIVTLVFERVSNTKTLVEVIEAIDIDYPLETSIYAGLVPGADLLGETFDAKVGRCFDIRMEAPHESRP